MNIEKLTLEKEDFIPLDGYFIQRDEDKIIFGPSFRSFLPDLMFEAGRYCIVKGYAERISLTYDGDKEIVIRFHDEDPEYDEKIILTLE